MILFILSCSVFLLLVLFFVVGLAVLALVCGLHIVFMALGCFSHVVACFFGVAFILFVLLLLF